MKHIYYTALLLCLGVFGYAQTKTADTAKLINLNEVVIKGNRVPLSLQGNPGAVSVVTNNQLSVIPKGIGAEEALRLVPGVRIDNQHDGERVHLSIRGQGILTERGLRGVGVLVDGIPVNDPSGFAPDLYDVDWSTVSSIEVFRGPAGIYGGGGAAGLLNITTRSSYNGKIGGEISQELGSNGFNRTFAAIGGTIPANQNKSGYQGKTGYRVSFSRSAGDGYRDHQGFYSNKLYEKLTFNPIEKLTVTQIISHTDYFQQNPEGLNLMQFDNLRQANPDASPFNEYQKTNRTTVGVNGSYRFNTHHEVMATTWYRTWNYKETSNRAAEYRTYTVPGASMQYNLHLGETSKVKNTISAGADFLGQDISVYKLQSAANPAREESMDETNLETDVLLANQLISQWNTGLWASWKAEAGDLSVLASLRYDDMSNELTNKMMAGDTATTSKDFSHTTFRIGANLKLGNSGNVFANYSQGFMPPSTEELASNPTGYSGFNTHLVPATSSCFEVGFRGVIAENLYYELTVFNMKTEDDFFRFKQSGRGNQEVFYGNAGNSKRNGIEALLSYKWNDRLSADVAYTYSDYKYTSSTIDPIYTDTAYVLTTPPASGQWLPNSPRHQLFAEVKYNLTKHIHVMVGTEYQSEWAIYTDANAYSGDYDPTIYKNWQDGFNLWNARVSYTWALKGLTGEFSIAGRNLTDATYMAFTEPDPDGNSYQPGPARELFGSLKIGF